MLEQAGYNRGGRRLYTIHFAEPDVGDDKWQGFGITMRESGISYLRFARVSAGPNAGLDEGVQDLDEKQRPRPDVNGEYGYRLVLDAGGLVKEWVNRGPDGEDKANSHGVLKEIRSHDRFGNVIDARTVDEQGSPASSRLGPASTRIQYDEAGNPTRMSFFDVKGQPVVAQALGAAGIGFTYDRRGQITSQTFFGPDQKMVVGQPGFAKQTSEWWSATRSLRAILRCEWTACPSARGRVRGHDRLGAAGIPDRDYLSG